MAWSTIDDWVGTFLIVVLALVQVVCFAWIFGIERGLRELKLGAHLPIPRALGFILKYLTPVYLIVMIGFFCVQALPGWIDSAASQPVARLALGLIALTIAILVVMTAIGVRRWRALGLDVDGDRPPDDESVPVPALRGTVR
jgi:hypothetical protein